MGGHGNSIGGVIVDGGSFNWSAEAGRYPLLSEPRPEYHGIKLHETFGNFAFAIAARVLGLRDLGPAISPFNAFLFITGIETLPLRMQRHCENALAVAEWLSKHPEVTWVSYAGLPGDRYHNLAKKYCPKGAGAVLTFGVRGGHAAGVKIVESVKLFSHLANIGDTRSLIIHPASTTHSQLSDEAKTASGAGPDAMRLSVGMEDVDDIIADLDQALKAAASVVARTRRCFDPGAASRSAAARIARLHPAPRRADLLHRTRLHGRARIPPPARRWHRCGEAAM